MICRFDNWRALLCIALFGTTLHGAFAVTSVHIPDRPVTQQQSFRLVAATSKTMTNTGLATAGRSDANGMVSSDMKSISFSGRTVRLVVRTGPDNDMLSYRIEGLRNPTVVVQRGSTLKVLFVNTDGDMFHNIRFGAWRISFPNTADALLKTSVGTAPLPHISGAILHASELVVKAPMKPGKYAYFCTVRGHAQGGMRGTIQVR